jgi:two-component system chemotaxis response regulator CheB
MVREKTSLTCPDCRGAVERITHDSIVQYRCRVGHVYSPETALAVHNDTEENVLWAAIVALEEGADYANEIAEVMPKDVSERLRKEAAGKRSLAEQVRRVVEDLPGVSARGHVP